MQQVFQLGMGFIVSATLGTAIQFDIPRVVPPQSPLAVIEARPK
jgi:hypothetical protein